MSSMQSKDRKLMTFALILAATVICLIIIFVTYKVKDAKARASKTDEPDTTYITVTPDAETSPTGSSERDDTIDDDFEGYLGLVELDGQDYPLLIYGGLSYALIGDHAEIIYTAYSDDSRGTYNIHESVEFEGYIFPVTTISDQAFYSFGELSYLTVPNSITFIGDDAFSNCDSLFGISLPDTLTHLGAYAFGDCTALTDIELPDSLNELSPELFFNCYNLKTVKLPAGLTEIPDELFSGCEGLETVEMPASVRVLGEDAFWCCEALQSIMLPEGLVSIGDSCFYDCLTLTEITIPSTVTSIGEAAFDFCNGLQTITAPTAFGEVLDEYHYYGIDIVLY